MLTVLPFHVPLYVQSMETKNNILDVTISKIGLNHFFCVSPHLFLLLLLLLLLLLVVVLLLSFLLLLLLIYNMCPIYLHIAIITFFFFSFFKVQEVNVTRAYIC